MTTLEMHTKVGLGTMRPPKPEVFLFEYLLATGEDLNLLHKAQTNPAETMREFGLDAAQIEAVLAGSQDTRDRMEYELLTWDAGTHVNTRMTMMSDPLPPPPWKDPETEYKASGWGGYPITTHEK